MSGTSRCRTISVAPDAVRLAEIRRFVEETAVEAALDEEKIFDLKVAVSEACANAVEHSGGEHAPLEICAFVYSDRIVFEVSDSGDFRVPAAQLRSGRDNRGLGLPLMAALMDEVCISKTPRGGTKVALSLLL